MRHGTILAAVVCAVLGAVLAPGCDQLGLGGYGGGGYGGEACGGAGGYGGGGSGGAAPAGGCAPKNVCVDMYTRCQDIGYPCTRQIEKGKTLCAICEADCIDRRQYTYTECYKCGFYDP